MATITVDGQAIEAPDGAPLVEILRNNGFYVSSLCYIDGLKPYAGCRTCYVDIQGQPGLQLSCTSIVQDGMEVVTNSDEVREARRSIMAIILANHSDRCLTCHRREHCHPGDICLRDDVVTHRCLTCAKNYRCELQATCEMVGMSGYEPWIGEERSYYQSEQPPADRANPFFEFDPQMCIICTRCVRACDEIRHTGAITLAGRGYETEIAFGPGGPIHESNCDFCGACIDACPVAALMEHPNKWVAKPDRWTTTTCDSCAVGCSIQLGTTDGRGVIVRPGEANEFSGTQLCVRGRFHYDSLKPRERLQRHQVRRGPIFAPTHFEDAIEEAATALREAAEQGPVGVLGGATLTNEEALLVREIARKAFGREADTSIGPVVRAVTKALDERFETWRLPATLDSILEAQAIVVVADDLEESHNVASMRIKDAVVNNGARLVVIGALRSELVDFAHAWIRPEPGEEGQAAAHLAQAIEGKQAASDEIGAAAEILAGVEGARLVVCGPNPVSPPIAGAMTGGAANLAIALSGEEAGRHLVVLPAEANVHGLLDVGVGAEDGGAALEGLAGLLVVRDDPTMRLPGAGEALEQIGTIVAIDNVQHPTASLARVVIADGRAYASEGTYTTGDYRVQRLTPAVQPEGEAVRCFDALRALAVALGVEAPATPDDALGVLAGEREEYRAAWDLLVGDGVRLELPAPASARAMALATPSVEQGTRLIVSRDLYTALDAAALRHEEAEKLHRMDRIQVSEEDAERLGIEDGTEIEITARNGYSLRAPATVTERVPEGAVYVSSLLQGGAVVHLLADDALPAVEVKLAEAVPA